MTQHHCTVCHRMFFNINAFDAHRVKGNCVRPTKRIGLVGGPGVDGHTVWRLA